MKRMILRIFIIAALFVLAACGVSQKAPTPPGNATLPPADQQETSPAPTESDVPADTISEDASPTATAETAVTLTVDGQTFSATLLDNESVRQLVEQFPLTLDMSELNGNEKYFYMDNELPTDSYQPEQIHAGDLMLYGNNCVVLFYESFSSGYSYTRLGSVDDPAGLAEALGTGSVEVAFAVRDDG